MSLIDFVLYSLYGGQQAALILSEYTHISSLVKYSRLPSPKRKTFKNNILFKNRYIK